MHSSAEAPDEDSPFISWGRCYYDGSGDEAPSRYIPCGNVNFGHVSCCESQDMCLSSNACYNGQYGVTYLAGCTDETYSSDKCPNKGDYTDDAWVGLSYCNGTSNEWVGCETNRGINTVTKAKPCWCPTTSRTVAFTDASRLANIVSLGTATGESITWQGGFLPNTQTVATSTSSTATSSTETQSQTTEATTTDPTPIATSPLPSEQSQDADPGQLAVGAKVGIGIGAGLGLVALLIVIVMIARRSRRRDIAEPEEHKPTSAQPVALYNDDDPRSPTWSGHKSELDAIGTAKSTSPRWGNFSSAKSEIEGSPAVGTKGRPLKNGGYEMPGQRGTVYEMPA